MIKITILILILLPFIRMVNIVYFRLTVREGQKVIAKAFSDNPYYDELEKYYEGVIVKRGQLKVELDNGYVYHIADLYPSYYLLRRIKL
jgi:hypothetical protein